jgi:hypothetical protein
MSEPWYRNIRGHEVGAKGGQLMCQQCWKPWPCPAVVADAALGGDPDAPK